MAAPVYNATLVFDDASLLSSAWMHVLFGLPPGFASQCKTTAEWQLMLKLVDLVRGQQVAAVESEGQIVSFALEPAEMTVDWNLQGATPALLLRRLLICAEEVLRMLSQAELDLMSDCIFQLILVLLFCKNDDSPAQVAFLDTEVPCARLHSKSDGANGVINISPTYCPGSPQQSDKAAAGAGAAPKADLICSIADAQGQLVNYVIELRCLRFQHNSWTKNQIDLMPMHELMQLEIGKRAGQIEPLRHEANNITRVKHVVAEALHQSCSKYSLTLDGHAWPPAESTPVRHLSVVAMGQRVVVSDTSCTGEPSYRSWTLPQINLAPIAAAPVVAAAAPAATVTSVESLWSRSHEIRAVASWHLGYVRHCAAQFRHLGDAWVASAEVQHADRRVAEMAAQNRDLQATIAKLTAKNEQLMQDARASQAQLEAHAQAAQAQAAAVANSPPPQSHPQHARQSSGRGVTFQTMVPVAASPASAAGPMRTPSPALAGAGTGAQARSPSPAAAAPSLPPTSAAQNELPVSRPMSSPVAPRTVAASLQSTPVKFAAAPAPAVVQAPTPALTQAPAATAVAAAPKTSHKTVHFQQPAQTQPQQATARAPQAVQAPQAAPQQQQQQVQQQQQPARAAYVAPTVAAAPASAAAAPAAASPPPMVKSPSVGRVWPPPPPAGAPSTPVAAASPVPAAAAPYVVDDSPAASAASAHDADESEEPVGPSKVQLDWAKWSGPRTGSKDKQ